MKIIRASTLQTHLGLIFLLLLLVPTSLVAWLAYTRAVELTKSERIKTVGRVADARHEQLTMVFQRAVGRAESALMDLRHRCGRLADHPDCFRQGLEPFIRSEGALGAMIATHGGTGVTMGESHVVAAEMPSFKPGQLAQFAPRGRGLRRDYFIVAADPREKLWLAVTYPVTVIQSIFISHSDLGQSGETFLADGEGLFITNGRYPSTQGHSDPISAIPMRRCLTPESNEMLGLDYRDAPVIHGFRFIPEIGGGCIMAHVDQAEAFKPLTVMRNRTLAAMLGFAVLAVLTAVYFSRRISAPIRQLTRVTRAVAAGDVAVRAVPEGYREVVELAAAFNTMADQMAAINADLEYRVWQRTESLRESEERWQFAIDGAGDGVWDWNMDSGRIVFSRRYLEMLGYADDVEWNCLDDWKSHVNPEEMRQAMAALEAYLDGKIPAYSAEYRMQCADGDWKWMLARGKVVSRAADGRPLRLIGTHADISERKRTLAALEASEARFRSLFENANTGIAATDRHGQIGHFNEAFRAMLGYDAEALQHMNFAEFTHADDLQKELLLFDEILAGQREHYRITKRYRASDNRWLWVDISVGVVRNAQGKVDHLVGVVQDITSRMRLEKNLNLLAAVFTNSGEGIVITDAANRIVRVNQAFTRLTGYEEAEVFGQDPKILSAGRTSPELYREMWSSLTERGQWEGELWDRRKDGESYPKWASLTVVRDADGHVTHHIASFTNISERKASEARLLHLAHHDPLTQLPNRLNLPDRLEQAIGYAKRNGQQLAFMLIDLDRFKAINDSLGHHVGDLLLIEVARRLVASVRESDIVARLGGDEFVVVITAMESTDDAARVAAKIVDAVSAPYAITDDGLRTSPSIGICIYPDDAVDIGDLMKNADMAMYHAKAKGRSNYQFFTEELNRVAAERMSLEADLRSAIDSRQFVLHYQPQLDLRSGRITGVEALVRWQHPQRGLVPPLAFIPVAEETGLIIPLGDWILWEACRQLKAWQMAGIVGLRMSVNLSASQFHDTRLPQRIDALLAEFDLDAAQLDLEVTESVSMESPADAIATMRTLAARGMTLSIDDFGTGYSSLAYLKLFPIHSLKIDRSFVKDIETDPNDADICDVTLLLAHKLGLEVVAEGVETRAQLKFLLSIGCERVQGYLISKPLPAAVAEEFMRNSEPLNGIGTIELWTGP